MRAALLASLCVDSRLVGGEMTTVTSRLQRHVLLALAWLAIFILAPAISMASAHITIINSNQTGVGLNDPTPATPVGGNPGTTIGEQRLNALEYAAGLWAALLDSSVEIRIQASFDALTCTASSAVLGEGSPAHILMDFPNAPLAGTWYPAALASRIAGVDLIATAQSHIRLHFNSGIGTTGCLEGAQWYYGFDNNHGDRLDLVTIFLHEAGHGLGFVTLVDPTSGAEFLGQPDVFEAHILDTTSNKHWIDMTDAERKVSAVNTGRVLWDGLAVQAAVPSTLEGLPLLTVTAPAAIAGDYSLGTASFGGALSADGLIGSLVAASDPADAAGPSSTDACETLTNASEVNGRVALVDRGTCTFVTKARNAQAAGATAMVVVNNVADTSPLAIAGEDPTITIPVVSVTQADGSVIRASLTSGVTVDLRINPRRLAGAGSEDRMRLFAPNPVQSGSSISHWDTSARPDLLMEPDISGDLPHGVDLTLPLLRDIGWKSEAIPQEAPRLRIFELDLHLHPPTRALAPRHS